MNSESQGALQSIFTVELVAGLLLSVGWVGHPCLLSSRRDVSQSDASDAAAQETQGESASMCTRKVYRDKQYQWLIY